MAQGRRAALAAALGFGLGNFAHTLFAVVGLSTLVMSSATAFQIVKIAGAAYLVYLGVKLLGSSSGFSPTTEATRKTSWMILRQSLVANILNPKVAVFFLAFFPQFIDRNRGNPQFQMVILGCVFVVLVLFGFGLVGLCSASIGAWLRKNAKAEKRVGQVAGSVLVLLGVKLALP
jgi:threonine/homoserine/homoserine lactone efflux protein